MGESTMKKILVYFVFCIVIQTISTQSVVELIEAKPNGYERSSEKYISKIEHALEEDEFLYEELMFVSTSNDEVYTFVGDRVILPCEFKICPSNGEAVTVTWKRGTNPQTAARIARCRNFDPNTGACEHLELFSDHFSGRVSLNPGTTDLSINQIRETDNGNFWCQVQTNDNNELGTDTKSVCIRVRQSQSERPKFNRVILNTNFMEATSGETVVLKCKCDGYHCDDFAWYKGPFNEWGNSFEEIHNKTTRYRMDPKITTSPAWKNRVSFSGFDMTIHAVEESDAGRYWCHVSGAGYFNLGETGTDAKSIVLTINREGAYSCQ